MADVTGWLMLRMPLNAVNFRGCHCSPRYSAAQQCNRAWIAGPANAAAGPEGSRRWAPLLAALLGGGGSGAAVRIAATALVAITALAMSGCEEETDANVARLKLKAETFYVEIAADDGTRMRGLGGRDHIEDDGGMLFVFPRAERRQFVMRDCLVPIDIAFLDGSGRVLTMHTMPTEELQREGETDRQYEDRLTRYSSRFPCEFVLELKAGTLERLGAEEGDLAEFDVAGLKNRVK